VSQVQDAVRRYLGTNVPGALALLAGEPLLRTSDAANVVRGWVRWFHDNGQPDVALEVRERLAFLEYSIAAPTPTAALDLYTAHRELIDAEDESEALAVLTARPELCTPAARAVTRVSFSAAAARASDNPAVVDELRSTELLLALLCEDRMPSVAVASGQAQSSRETVSLFGQAPGTGAVADRWPKFLDVAQLVEAAESEGNPWDAIQLCLLALFRLDPIAQRARWMSIRQRIFGVISGLVTDRVDEQQRRDVVDDSGVDWGRTGCREAEREARLGLQYLIEADGPGGSNAVEAAIVALSRARATCNAVRAPALAAVVERHLGIGYAMRRSASPATDVQRSLEHTQAALRMAPAGHPRAACLIGVANALCDLVTTARHDALKRALAHAMEAAQIWWALGDVDRWAGAQHTIGVVHDAFGDVTNRARAVDAYYRALSVPPGGRPGGSWGLVEWATTMNNLAAGMLATEAAVVSTQIERAIGYLEIALTVRPLDRRPVDWAATEHNLGHAYSLRTEGIPAANLRRAASHLEAALQVRRADTRPGEWLDTISLLGSVRRAQHQHEAALALYRDGLAVIPSDEAPLQHASLLINIGNVHLDAHDDGDMDALAEAIGAYREAVELARPAGNRHLARRAARSLGNAYARRQAWAEAASAYRHAADLDETIYQISVTLSGQETELEQASGLYPLLAVALARAGRHRSAVEAAEAGRARALGETLHRGRAEWDELAGTYPAEHAAYTEAVRRLDEAESAERAFWTNGAVTDPERRDELARLHAATQRAHDAFRAVSAIIGALPGTAHLVTAPGMDEILAATSPGEAVVYLLTTSFGTVALIAEADILQLIDLPSLTEAAVTPLLAEITDGVPTAGLLAGLVVDDDELEILRTAVDRVVHDLGAVLMRPIADILRARGVSAVTFVPGGRLAALPLHACLISGDGDHRHFCDEFVVSYAPSMTVRHYAEARRGRNHSGVVVSAIDSELPTAPWEQDLLALRFPGVHRYTDPAPADLLNSVASADLVHIACHGELDLDQPLRSGFHLGGQLLTLEQLLATRAFAGVRLVIATACSSAAVHVAHRPDEVIGLPAGLQHAGAAAIVGSLWPIDDSVGALFTAKFLELTRDGHRPADALARTQRWLRTVQANELRDFTIAASSGALPASLEELCRWLDPLDEEPPFADPLDWAAFVIVGSIGETDISRPVRT
jgi:CHAT domain-containing protein/tetratricopeptide (TPR) repeat protein